MERIAFIARAQFVSWSAVLLTLGAAVAICVFLALYLSRDGEPVSAFSVVPLAVALSLLGARALHWYGYAESYESVSVAMTDYTSGGYALAGVFGGCMLAAAVLRLVRVSGNLPRMLDCMCPAGAAGIAIGRLASLFDASDRGQMVASIRTLPWVYPVTNVTSGATEYRLATFMLQAMVAGLLFLVLTVWCLMGKKRSVKDGDPTLVFLMCYGASQILLDSTRYDSMYLRSNGFVSIEQILGLAALLLAVAVFSVRLVKQQSMRKWYLILWGLLAALMGGAGYMEYHVQRHGNQAVMAYSIMGTCLAVAVAVTLLIRYLAEHPMEEIINRLKKTGCP